MMNKNESIFHKLKGEGFYQVQAKKDEAVVYLYDEISPWGILADQFVKDLAAITSPTIHLRVNSPGGSVFDGLSIYNTIKQHPSKVIAHIDGLAASIASVIVMAADEVRMSEKSFLMIHEPWSLVIGPAAMMRKEADLLDKVAVPITDAYFEKTGKEKEEIAALMAEETWLSAAEALEAGFADGLDEVKEEVEAKVSGLLFDLSRYSRAPEKLTNPESGEEAKRPTIRDAERGLCKEGFSQAQAKEILSKGFAGGLRDVASEQKLSDGKEAQREVEVPVQREVEPPSVKGIDIDHLLQIRAEELAPSP